MQKELLQLFALFVFYKQRVIKAAVGVESALLSTFQPQDWSRWAAHAAEARLGLNTQKAASTARNEAGLGPVPETGKGPRSDPSPGRLRGTGAENPAPGPGPPQPRPAESDQRLPQRGLTFSAGLLARGPLWMRSRGRKRRREEQRWRDRGKCGYNDLNLPVLTLRNRLICVCVLYAKLTAKLHPC